VAWHASKPGNTKGEAGWAVFVAHSTNGGKSFAPEKLATAEPTGACGCCGMKAFADTQGNALPESGQADGLPVWSLATAFAKSEGSFVIVLGFPFALRFIPWQATSTVSFL